MSDAQTIIPSIVAALASAGTTAAMLPALFRGKLRHERELVEMNRSWDLRFNDQRTAADAALRDRDEIIDRLESSLSKTEGELKDQYRVNAEQNKEVYQAVRWLQGLSGLAERDRRGARE